MLTLNLQYVIIDLWLILVSVCSIIAFNCSGHLGRMTVLVSLTGSYEGANA